MDGRTNRFLGLRVGTGVWRRLLISCCTTIAAPNSAHVFRAGERGGREGVQRGGGIESNSKLATLPWANKGSDHHGYSRPCSHVRHTQTHRIPNRPTRHSVGRQNARPCRRVALSSRRCGPSLLSRYAIHEAFRLRCLGRCHSRLSLRLVLLGYVNMQLRVH